MSATTQRFCPLCDRAFSRGEAVLRCDGCDVLHHPACWVRNDGCATATGHRSSPLALAYGIERPPAPRAGPGHDTPIIGADVIGMLHEPAIGESQPLPPPPPGATRHLDAEPIGAVTVVPALPATPPRRRDPAPYIADRPDLARRHPTSPDPALARRNLPRLYGNHRILGYWYVPAAMLVAVGVAVGIILLVEALFGGDDSSGATAAPTVQVSTPEPADTGVPATSPAGRGTAALASPTGTRVAGKFRPGETLVVSGTGDCLNVRATPGRAGAVVECLADGSELTAVDGPQSADGISWWRVKGATAEGWAAEEFLNRR